MNIPFSQWLINELDQRGMSAADLARKAKISKGSLSHIINDSRKPGTDLCSSIAKAFNIPPETVYRAAGLLPPEQPETAHLKELAFLAAQLPDQELDDLIRYARLRLSITEERGTYETEQDK